MPSRYEAASESCSWARGSLAGMLTRVGGWGLWLGPTDLKGNSVSGKCKLCSKRRIRDKQQKNPVKPERASPRF